MMFLLAVMAMMSVSAQTRWGYFTRDYEYYKKGECIMYQIDRNGMVLLPEGAEFCNPIPASYVKFSGFYVVEIVDPEDNYVNIRKGPGTNYSIIRRVHTYDWCCDHNQPERWLVKKKKSNWWELYTFSREFIGYIYHNRVRDVTMPEFY